MSPLLWKLLTPISLSSPKELIDKKMCGIILNTFDFLDSLPAGMQCSNSNNLSLGIQVSSFSSWHFLDNSTS